MLIRCLGCMERFSDEFEICPHCGHIIDSPAEEAIHIEPGTLLYDRYIIGKVIGYGGFGVTYIGWDGRLQQKVAIKEYLPGEFSTRAPGQTQVTVFGGEKDEQFRSGMKKFVDEAKRLAKFHSEDGIVKIFDSFEENNTAYIVMEYLDGITLGEYLKQVKTIPEEKAVQIILPVMKSLQAVHAEGILHRDIAPDNIFLTKSGDVKLIDFGASRYATTSHSRSLTVIIKPGYSPEEQYRSRGDQGPHTDVYSLAATLYKMITGKTPSDAMERRVKYENNNKDILEDPHKIVKNISPARENAIMNALNVRIEDRTPDIASFVKELQAKTPVKRRYGKIKKLDFYRWPLWVKIGVPVALSLFLVFGVLMLTGVIKFSFFSEEIVIPENIVQAPNVEGMQKNDAIAALENVGLLAVADGSVESKYIPAGEIIIQSPVGGSYVQRNGTVKLTLSSGMGVQAPENGVSTVPLVLWKPEEEARELLKTAGLGEPIIKTEYDETVPAGSIAAQDPEAGTKVAEGSSITITVSLGPQSFKLPDVSGKYYSDAVSELEALGLMVNLQYEKSNEVAEDHVITQAPLGDADVYRGDSVTLTICSGKETVVVADVVGKHQTDAISELESLGFAVYVIENYSDVEVGHVISQTPTGGSNQLPGSTVTIYVSKGKMSVNVKLNANGGWVETETVSVYQGSAYGTLPEPVREGYRFLGWYTENNGGEKVDAETNVSVEYTHTLYAHWKAKEYSVNFDANGGKCDKSSLAVVYDSEIGTMPVATKTGSAFKGWYTEKDGGTLVQNTDIYNTAGDTTVYAHWEENAFNILFDANGGSVSVSSKAVTYNSTYGDLPTPNREGYSFQGWYTALSGGTKISATDKITVTSDFTLYAQWKANDYTIYFNTDGGTAVSNMTVTFGGSYGDLPTTSKTGYSFQGWLDEDGNKFVNTTHNVASDITLTALWLRITHTVKFDYVSDVITVFYGETCSLPVVSREHYTFDGWYNAKNDGIMITDTTPITSDMTLYARWSRIVYTVKFDYISDTMTVNSGDACGTLPTPSREHYTFDGWYTSSSGGSKVTNSTVVTSDMTLYAHWSRIVYTIKFDYISDTMTVNSGDACGTLPTPSREHYKFDGWYTSSSGGSKVTSSTVVTSNMTLYAHWSVKQYTYSIVYKSSNGTSLGTSSATYNYGTTNTISPKSFAGYSTPSSQSVSWNSSSKTITFTYTPVSTSTTQSLTSGTWWEDYKYGVKYGITFSVSGEYRNRTANSVEVRVVWTQTIYQAMYGYSQYFYASFHHNGSNRGNTGNVQIASTTTWPYTSTNGPYHNGSVTAYSGWVKVSLDTTSATTVTVNCDWWSSVDSGSWSGKTISIPAY